METLYFDDGSWRRLPWLTPLAMLLTLASLMAFMRLIEQGGGRSPARGFVQVEILEPPPVAADQAPPRPAAPPPPARPRPQQPPQPARPKPQAPAVVPAAPRSVVETPPAPAEAEGPREQAPPATVATPAAPARSGGASSSAPSRPSAPTTASIPSGGMPGGGQMGARAIYQPLPELPDSLRRRNFDVVAIARFQVATNGTAHVDLVQPTADPELNRLLVETLKRWRFFPALDGGKPVASTVDVRIPISVH